MDPGEQLRTSTPCFSSSGTGIPQEMQRELLAGLMKEDDRELRAFAAKNLWAVSRLPLEFAVLGPRVTIVRFGVTLILPPLLGFLAEGLLGRRVERIREAVVS